MADPAVYVVLGMHRSGTSTVTRALEVLGVELGEHFLPPQNDNVKGFWEDRELNAFNMEILSALDSDWHYQVPVSDADCRRLESQGLIQTGVQLLSDRLSRHKRFGFKDPRIVRLLPVWQRIFSACNVEPRYILAVRNPLSVIDSLASRDGFPAEKTCLLWLGHNLAGARAIAACRPVVLDFDLLLDSPRDELQRLAQQLDLEVNTTGLEDYVNHYLDTGLRHTRYSIEDLRARDDCVPMVGEVYVLLWNVARGTAGLDTEEGRRVLKRCADGYDDLGPALRLLDRMSREEVTLKQSLARERQTVDKLKLSVRMGEETVAERDRMIRLLEQDVETSERQRQDAEHTMLNLMASRSWKLTAPLRALSRRGAALGVRVSQLIARRRQE